MMGVSTRRHGNIRMGIRVISTVTLAQQSDRPALVREDDFVELGSHGSAHVGCGVDALAADDVPAQLEGTEGVHHLGDGRVHRRGDIARMYAPLFVHQMGQNSPLNSHGRSVGATLNLVLLPREHSERLS